MVDYCGWLLSFCSHGAIKSPARAIVSTIYPGVSLVLSQQNWNAPYEFASVANKSKTSQGPPTFIARSLIFGYLQESKSAQQGVKTLLLGSWRPKLFSWHSPSRQDRHYIYCKPSNILSEGLCTQSTIATTATTAAHFLAPRQNSKNFLIFARWSRQDCYCPCDLYQAGQGHKEKSNN
jgi:hypothetical protein